jgi:uncharacterized protein (TIGR01244 family)
MNTLVTRLFAVVIVVGLPVAGVHAQQVTKKFVSGIVNFAQVETTVACGGATTPEAIAELKKMGFASVINFRLATERGTDIPSEAAAAKAAGMRFVHIPYDTQAKDPGVAERFLSEIVKPGTQPAYIHCAGGSRAAGMWLVKRVLVDKWDVDRATKEATALGLANDRVKRYAMSYIEAHSK